MNEREIYSKTEAGREEMRTRALHLAGALRTVLLLVDGHRTVAQLKELMTGGKAPPDALEQLLALGLIAFQANAPADVAAPIAAPVAAPKAAASPRAAPLPPALPVSAPPPPAPVAPKASKYGSAPILEPKFGTASSIGGAGLDSSELLSTDAANRFNRLYTLMNEIVSDYLGLRGYFMQLKIEKCSSTEELLALQEELGTAIAKAHGREVAAELVNRIQAVG
jgi:hypothetical protein